MRKIIIEYVPSIKMQQGGLTNADLLTGNYLTESADPNIEVEDGEHTLNSQTGQVQEVVGKTHVQGGEKVNLPDQSKVLSDYTKIGASNVKIFGEMFDVKVKAADTFATVLDRYNSKIGVKKLEEEEKELLEKVEKNSKSSIDKTTKQINEDFLAQEVAEVNKKKEALNGLKQQAFEAIFAEQEKIPKKGNGTQVLDKSGNPIKQEGGEQQGQPDPQQIIQAYAEMAGQDPRQIIQQLQQLPPEEQQAALGQMMQALQGGQEQPQMRYGGMYEELPKHQDQGVVNSTLLKDFSNKPFDVTWLPYTQRDIATNEIWKGANYENQWLPMVEKTMGNTSTAKKVDQWLTENKDTFSPNIQKQLEGLTGEARYAKIKALATDKFPGLFHNAVLQGIEKTATPEVAAEPIKEQPGVEPQRVQRDVVKDVLYDKSLPFLMSPSAPIAPYLQQVDLSRLEGQKGSVENQLQASASARQAAMDATRGLPPAQAAAMMANYLATSGQQDTQGIAAQEVQDLQNKARIEQFNVGQADKEQILNEQLKKQYEKEAFATLNTNEQNWRNYYDANQANQKAMSDEIERRNIMNLGLTNYQMNGSGGFEFVNKSPFQGADQAAAAYGRWFQSLTPEQQVAERKKRYEAAQKTGIA